jgi:hypothetical protein
MSIAKRFLESGTIAVPLSITIVFGVLLVPVSTGLPWAPDLSWRFEMLILGSCAFVSYGLLCAAVARLRLHSRLGWSREAVHLVLVFPFTVGLSISGLVAVLRLIALLRSLFQNN